ncbi:nucleoside triphosphate pyrophosphohydrolase [Paenibacillus sp. FSL H7-0326]|uniref:nucleoside triphosphate pyrophosphohydrolase n=1 Tax=Paenibacillus sp. FSL H7-0326 TaxID=1921144 RepID=UPI002116FEE3|nr:nucleoside triphosphate pyrophosphohydrolase [Paenibacillus sp. FSL H7-0326]
MIVGTGGQSEASFTGEKKTYNKLVRDQIPTIIASKGDSCRITVLDQEQYRSELRAKLMEEIEEYYATDHDEEALGELADVLEVIRALSKVHGSTPEELENKRVEKQKLRGGFEGRVYLIDTTVQ